MADVCHTCPLWVQIRGTDPNTGETIADEWQCSLTWLPKLLIENAQQSRQTGASTDKVATEIHEFHQSMNNANAVAARLFTAAAEREQNRNTLTGPKDITPDEEP